jgi:hypothetical protein
MGNSALDALIEGIVKNASEKLISDEYSQAVVESTKYLSSIEGLKPDIKKAYAAVIPKLYGIRAQSEYMLWLQTKDEHQLQVSKVDIDKATSAVETLYRDRSSENLIILKESILNLISEDENQRKESLKKIIELKIEVVAAKQETSNITLSKLWPYLLFFLTGAAAWGIFPLIFLIPGGSNSTVLIVIAGILFFLLFMLTLKGWDWYSEYKFGSYGSLIKYMATLFIGITIIGLIPVCYWTGKGIFRWVNERRD